jgi:hypothetical protein
MIDLIKVAPQIGAIVPDLIVKNMDFKDQDEMVRRLRRTLPPGLVPPDQKDEQIPPPQPPMDVVLKQQELKLKEMDLMLKAKQLDMDTALREIEVKSSAILKVAQAEAAELGQQIEQYKVIVEGLRPQQTPAQGGKQYDNQGM